MVVPSVLGIMGYFRYEDTIWDVAGYFYNGLLSED